jgi:hypothetical protein
MINEQNEKMNTISINHYLREDIDNLLFSEVIKDMTKFSSSSMSALSRKERDKVALSSMINDWIDNKEAVQIAYSLREDINGVALGEIMKYFIKFSLSTPKERICCTVQNSDHDMQNKTIYKGIILIMTCKQ